MQTSGALDIAPGSNLRNLFGLTSNLSEMSADGQEEDPAPPEFLPLKDSWRGEPWSIQCHYVCQL